MLQEARSKLPNWHQNIQDEKLVLTNDLDSLASCYVLNKLFNCSVQGFYDFEGIYFADGEVKKCIGVDLDSTAGKVFGNHYCYHRNKNAVNLNNIYKVKYYQKYPMSTLLMLLSLYDIDITKWTDEQLKVILAIDSAFKGYYTQNKHFKDVYLRWLEILQFEFLDSRILSNTTTDEFYEIIQKYSLSANITIDKNGYLQTDIDIAGLSNLFNLDLQLPKKKFQLHKRYNTKTIDMRYQSVPGANKVVSQAMIYKNKLVCTVA